MAQPEPVFDLISLSAGVFATLDQFRETLNEVDRYNHDHGDHMCAIWQEIDGVIKNNPGITSEGALAQAAAALENCEQNGTVQAYREVMAGLARRYAMGSLQDSNVIDLSRRLLHQPVELDKGSENSGGIFAAILKSAGNIQRLRLLAEQLGAATLFDSGLALLAGNASGADALDAGVALIVQNSPLAMPAHRARSAELVLRSLLMGVDQQTWDLTETAG